MFKIDFTYMIFYHKFPWYAGRYQISLMGESETKNILKINLTCEQKYDPCILSFTQVGHCNFAT
jgi:hypothetical protein